jgi:hypothetical protein
MLHSRRYTKSDPCNCGSLDRFCGPSTAPFYNLGVRELDERIISFTKASLSQA